MIHPSDVQELTDLLMNEDLSDIEDIGLADLLMN
jgi:hypothetical protein